MKSIKTKLIYAVIPSIELMTIEIEHMKNQHYDAYMMHIIQAIHNICSEISTAYSDNRENENSC